MPKLCREYHEVTENIGCSQGIVENAGWKWCPECGRSLAHLHTPSIAFGVETGQGGDREIRLLNTGIATVSVEVRLESNDGMIQIAGSGNSNSQKIDISSGVPSILKIRLNERIIPSPQAAYLYLFSNDNHRDLADRWKIDTRRYQTVPIRVDIQETSSVSTSPKTILLRSDSALRQIHLTCHGTENRQILSVDTPDGIVIEPTFAELAPGTTKTFTLRITSSTSNSLPYSLTFRLDKSESLVVPIRRPASVKPKVVFKAIIGIDFGTAFTSVAYRRPMLATRRGADMEDPVEFLSPLNEPGVPRFRTRIWVGKQGQIRFGADATNKYHDDESKGFLIREPKTLLRDPSSSRQNELIYPPCRPDDDAGEYYSQLSAVLQKVGSPWELAVVTEYLRWLRETMINPKLEQDFDDPNVKVKYVFSVPVLDRQLSDDSEHQHPIYARQLAAMKTCLEAAEYPMADIVFELEPVCAALGLVRPPTAQSCPQLNATNWPRLATERRPLETGHTISLFDSGGGTTDVVVMEVTLEPNGKNFSLGILQCLGVDSEEHTFGGEAVTTEMLNLILNPRKEYSSSDIGLRNVFVGIPENDYKVNTDSAGKIISSGLGLRDEGEKLKRQLAASPHDEIEAGDVRIKPRLLQDAVAQRTISLGTALSKRVFSDMPAMKINYYITVGGNTAVPAVERWVQQDVMNDLNAQNGRRFLNLPQKDRDLAVCYGAAWVPDAQIRSIAPYRLRLTADLAGEIVTLLDINPAKSDTKIKWLNELEIPPGEIEIKAISDFEGTSYLVDVIVLKNVEINISNIILIGEYINNKARLRYYFAESDPVNAKILWEYEL